MDFFGRNKGGERALLVQPHPSGRIDPEALTEFTELARSVGADILDTLTARIDAPNSRFYLGTGKVEQLRELKEGHGADLVLVNELKTTLLAKMQDSEVLDIKTVHRSLDGRAVSFDFRDESDGTQKFFAFAGPWLDALKNGFVLVFDELHDNLHPKMVQFLVQLFHNSETNPKNAQLVFTTNETSILNQDVFRRDQIWFCEKDDKQSTRLYPLTNFKPRKERENLEASYLAGRYGALPYLRSVSIGRGVPNGER